MWSPGLKQRAQGAESVRGNLSASEVLAVEMNVISGMTGKYMLWSNVR